MELPSRAVCERAAADSLASHEQIRACLSISEGESGTADPSALLGAVSAALPMNKSELGEIFQPSLSGLEPLHELDPGLQSWAIFGNFRPSR